MLDERDEVLAAQLHELFTAGDPVAARRSFDAARSRARRRRQLSAGLTCVALLAGAAVGVVALGRDSAPVHVTVASETTGTPTSEPASTTSAALIVRPPLASEIEGRIYGGVSLQEAAEGLPITEESPGLAGVSLSFFNGAITGNDGCRDFVGSYSRGAIPLETIIDTQVRPAVGCPNAELNNLVTEIISSSTPSLTGTTLIFTGPKGTLTLERQRYQRASVHCVPGVDSLHEEQITGYNPGGARGADAVQEVRAMLAASNETGALYTDVELALVIANSDQALVGGTKDGRPVLSVVLDHTGGGWAVASFAACMPDSRPAVIVVDTPPVVVGTTSPVDVTGKTFHITVVADRTVAIPIDPASSTITFNSDGTMTATVGCHLVDGQYTWRGSEMTFTGVSVTANLCGDSSDDLAAALQSALSTGSLSWADGRLAVTHAEGVLILDPE